MVAYESWEGEGQKGGRESCNRDDGLILGSCLGLPVVFARVLGVVENVEVWVCDCGRWKLGMTRQQAGLIGA